MHCPGDSTCSNQGFWSDCVEQIMGLIVFSPFFDKTNIDFISYFTGKCNEDTQFECSSGEGERTCIPKQFVLDGDEDCLDGSDEHSRLTFRYTISWINIGTPNFGLES